MKKILTTSLMIPLALFLSVFVYAAQFSFSPLDNSPDVYIANDDFTGFSKWTTGGEVADITYNQTTGSLYALASDGIYQYGIEEKVQNVTIPVNKGGELSISRNGEVALLQEELWLLVHLFESMDNFDVNFALWFINGALDIAYDQTTDNLYALTTSGVYQYGTVNVFGQDLSINEGGDISIGLEGEFAISPNDTSNEVLIYDADRELLETWTPDGAVADIAFDMVTGDLYAYTQSGVYRMGESGPVTTVTTATINGGGDMAIYSSAAVPIPTSALLLVSGLFGLVAFRRKTKKKYGE